VLQVEELDSHGGLDEIQELLLQRAEARAEAQAAAGGGGGGGAGGKGSEEEQQQEEQQQQQEEEEEESESEGKPWGKPVKSVKPKENVDVTAGMVQASVDSVVRFGYHHLGVRTRRLLAQGGYPQLLPGGAAAGESLQRFALRTLLADRCVTCVLLGARTDEYVDDALAVLAGAGEADADADAAVAARGARLASSCMYPLAPPVSRSGHALGAMAAGAVREAAGQLSALQRDIALGAATERAFAGVTANGYQHDEKGEGVWVSAVGGLPLFSSADKYDSGSGWPSFTRPLDAEHVLERLDKDGERIEVVDRRSGIHLGHVFDDGPEARGGRRFCINAGALEFVPARKEEGEQATASSGGEL
jgi:methionine-R-sulfoxide reductase